MRHYTRSTPDANEHHQQRTCRRNTCGIRFGRNPADRNLPAGKTNARRPAMHGYVSHMPPAHRESYQTSASSTQRIDANWRDKSRSRTQARPNAARSNCGAKKNDTRITQSNRVIRTGPVDRHFPLFVRSTDLCGKIATYTIVGRSKGVL